MTADGEVKIANACSNPDLFWALKGGGGGVRRRHPGDLAHARPARILRRRVRDRQGDVRRRLSPPGRQDRRILSRGAFQSALGRTDPDRARLRRRSRWCSRASISSRRRRSGARSSIGSPPRRRISRSCRRRRFFALPARHFWDPAVLKTRPGRRDRRRPRRRAGGQHFLGGQSRRGGRGLVRLPIRLAAGIAARSRPARKPRRCAVCGGEHRGVALHFNKGLAGAPAEAIAAAKDTPMNPAVATPSRWRSAAPWAARLSRRSRT